MWYCVLQSVFVIDLAWKVPGGDWLRSVFQWQTGNRKSMDFGTTLQDRNLIFQKMSTIHQRLLLWLEINMKRRFHSRKFVKYVFKSELICTGMYCIETNINNILTQILIFYSSIINVSIAVIHTDVFCSKTLISQQVINPCSIATDLT